MNRQDNKNTITPTAASELQLTGIKLPAVQTEDFGSILSAGYRPSEQHPQLHSPVYSSEDLSNLDLQCGMGRNIVVGGALLLAGAAAWEFGVEPRLDDRRLGQLEEENGKLKEELAEQLETIETQQEEIDKLGLGLKLLKTDRRVANVTVLDQGVDEEGIWTEVAFLETDLDGMPVGQPKQLTLRGDKLYIDYLVVQFDDRFVEEADPLRGKALCLLQSIFSDRQEPGDGFRIDTVGTRPSVYGDGQKLNEFQQEIWRNFWDIAHDVERQQSLGVRSVNGQAVSMKLREGYTYTFTIRSDGGFAVNPRESTESEIPDQEENN